MPDHKRRFERGRAADQHRQRDKQHRRHVFPRQPARADHQPEDACADGEEEQRESVVLIFRRIELHLIDVHIRTGGKLKFDLKILAVLFDGEMKLPVACARGNRKFAGRDRRVVRVRQPQNVVAVAANHPSEAVFARGQMHPAPPSHRNHAVFVAVRQRIPGQLLLKSHVIRRDVFKYFRLFQRARRKYQRAQQRGQQNRAVELRFPLHVILLNSLPFSLPVLKKGGCESVSPLNNQYAFAK